MNACLHSCVHGTSTLTARGERALKGTSPRGGAAAFGEEQLDRLASTRLDRLGTVRLHSWRRASAGRRRATRSTKPITAIPATNNVASNAMANGSGVRVMRFANKS